jgi:hypothetical protein
MKNALRAKKTKVASDKDKDIPLHSKHVRTMRYYRLIRWNEKLQQLLRWNLDPALYEEIATDEDALKNYISSISYDDLRILVRDGIIAPIPDSEVKRTGIAFTVIEERDGKARRRFILWPRQLNSEMQFYSPEFKVNTVVDDLAEIYAGTHAAVFDLAVGFWQCVLMEKVRAFFAFRTRYGTFAPKRMVMGARPAPEVMHEILHTLVAEALRRAPHVKVTEATYIDGVRFVGSRDDVVEISEHFRNVCIEAGATLKETSEAKCHTQGIWKGVMYDYIAKTVHLPEASLGKLEQCKRALFHNDATLADLMTAHGRLQYMSPVLQVKNPASFFPAMKLVRRKAAALQRGDARMSDKLSMWSVARESFTKWFEAVAENKPTHPLRDIAASEVEAWMFTDSSMTGFGGILVIGGLVHYFGRKWTEEELQHINVLEVGAVAKVTANFAHLLSHKRVHVFVDNTTAEATLKKGSSASWALANAIAQTLAEVKRAGPTSVTISWITSEQMPADGLSRGIRDEATMWELARGFVDGRWGGGRAIHFNPKTHLQRPARWEPRR